MAEQKIVQHRRDIYSNFAPSKIKPGEIIMITSGDPNSSSGKSVYACIAAGDVMQLATRDELKTYDQAAQTAAEAAAQSKTDAATIKGQIDEELTSAQNAAQAAAEQAEAAAQANGQIAEKTTAAQKAAEDAQAALESVQTKAADIEDILVHNSHTIATGDGATDENGSVYIYLSDYFKEILGEGQTGYRVFLQEEGEGKVYVSEKTDTFFVVSGTESLAFSWMIIL